MATCAFTPHLIEHLTSTERERLDEQLVILIERNFLLGGDAMGFLYGGEFHTRIQPAQVRLVQNKKIIHESLRPEARLYMAQRKALEADQTQLSHSLPWLFAPCTDWQDVRDVLTEMVVKLWPQVSAMPRTRPPGWPFERALDKHRFQTTIGLVEMHISNRIL